MDKKSKIIAIVAPSALILGFFIEDRFELTRGNMDQEIQDVPETVSRSQEAIERIVENEAQALVELNRLAQSSNKKSGQ